MNYLSVENISKRYGDKLLFDNLSFGIDQGQKVALVAKNGTGKTTLLRAISGIEPADTGEIIFRNDIHVGFLRQDEDLPGHQTILETVFKSENKTLSAIQNYQKAMNSEDPEKMETAIDTMNRLNAWDYEVKIKQILSQLGLEDWDQKIGKLSGGQKKRISLAKVLIEEPDFMILDEPTNHLDLDMIEWLEDYLSKNKATILMVTHDRYFLEVICDEILELERGELYRYKGNFSYYLEKKAEREEQEQATIAKAKNLYRKELEWMRRMPKARGTKQKARKGAFKDTQSIATQKIKRDHLSLDIKSERLGNKILEFHKVSKSYGILKMLDQFTYTFQKGEKVGMVGKNGVGKSTFLKMILQQESIDAGKIVVGDTVVFGYYSQKGLQLKEDKRVIEVIKDIAEVIPIEGGKQLSAAQFLERFLFPRKMQYNYVRTLSGGEKKRLYLVTVLMKNPNFLILDEPTNDLDIYTLEVLEEYLIQFKGCVIVVSHDRYFMDKIVDHIFVFKGEGKIKDIIGNYSAYREEQKAQEEAIKKKSTAPKTPKPSTNKTDKPKTKLSYKEKLEFESLEEEITQLESERDEMNVKIASGEAPADDDSFYKRLNELADLIETKTNRWMELAEYV